MKKKNIFILIGLAALAVFYFLSKKSGGSSGELPGEAETPGLSPNVPHAYEIRKWALLTGIPINIAFGLVKGESNFKANAFRAEPEQRRSFINRANTLKANSDATAKALGNAMLAFADKFPVTEWGSTGLSQVTPPVVFDAGKSTYRKRDLEDPEKNLELGFKHLAKLRARYGGNNEQALSAYNTGSPTRGVAYAQRILGLAAQFRAGGVY